jgi:hypothetical protein
MAVNKQSRSIRVDLSVIIGTLIVILVATVSFLSYRSSSKALTDIYLSQMSSTGNIVTDVVSNFYENQIITTNIISQDERIIEALETGKYDKASNFLSPYSTDNAHINSIVVAEVTDDWTILFDSIGGKAIGVKIKDNTPEIMEPTLGKKSGIGNPFISIIFV